MGANKRHRGDKFDSQGIRFQFKCAAANLMTLTPQNGASGRRPRGLDGRGRCGPGSAAVSGSLLSKWNESCQLSKSVRCPPQAWAYRAHLSLSCLCLLISMCIFLSLSPQGGILGTAPNANYSLASWKGTRLYHTPDVHNEGRDRWFIAKSLQKVLNNCSVCLHNHTFCHCCRFL